jgi:hypothetical protein
MAKKHPSMEMVKDLAKVFTKHNWSGQPIGLSDGPVKLKTMAADDSDNGPGSGSCPDGSEPQWVTYKLPDGTWASKKMCL